MLRKAFSVNLTSTYRDKKHKKSKLFGFAGVTLVLMALATSSAWAVPEAARYGHFTCTSCHVSPSGGGALTAYGRDFAVSKLSTWSYPGEESPLNGLIPVSDRWFVGGDLRGVSMQRRTGDTTFNKNWLMQADLELGGVVTSPFFDTGDPIFGSITIGSKPEGPYVAPESNDQKLMLRAFALRTDTFDDHLIFRVGAFIPKYGLMLSDHTMFVRAATGLAPDEEQTQAELTWQDDSLEATLSGLISTKLPERDEKTKNGVVANAAAYWRRNRFNVSVMRVTTAVGTAEKEDLSLGISSVVTLTKRLFAMAEVDRVTSVVTFGGNTSTTSGFASLYSLHAEVYKGIVPFLRYEFWDPQLGTKKTSRSRAAAGLIAYPRPHLNVEIRFSQAKSDSSTEPAQQTDLVAHYYF